MEDRGLEQSEAARRLALLLIPTPPTSLGHLRSGALSCGRVYRKVYAAGSREAQQRADDQIAEANDFLAGHQQSLAPGARRPIRGAIADVRRAKKRNRLTEIDAARFWLESLCTTVEHYLHETAR